MQNQQSLMLIKNQGFFPADLSYTNGLGDLHHLLARGLLTFYDSDKGLSTIRLIFSKSNYFKVWRHPPKVLDKLNSYRAEVQWVYNKGKNLLP